MLEDYDSEQLFNRDPFWYCDICGAQNSRLDGDCQFCEGEKAND